MILDKQNLFSDDQEVTESAASTNYIDLGDNDSKIQDDVEKNAEILAQVTTAFAGGTSIAVKIQEADETDFSDATDLHTTPAILLASLAAGYKFNLGRILPLITKQYVRLYYTVVGTMSAGAITAGLIVNNQTAK